MSEKRFTNVSMGREEAYCDFSIIKVGDKIISEIPTTDAIRICDLLNELLEDKEYFERKKEYFLSKWNIAHAGNIQLRQENKELKKENKQLRKYKERLERINGGYGHLTHRNGLTANEWLIESQERELKKKNEQIKCLKEENEQLRKLIDWSEINIADLIGDGV